MCGRYSLDIPWSILVDALNIKRPAEMQPEMPPRYNIAPTQPILMVGNGYDENREAILLRWGLVPTWVKDPGKFTLLTNARAETAIEKPSFRNAMRHRRMLVPASGFYEWKRYGRGQNSKGQKSQPYLVRPKGGGLVAFGGLMETYSDANGSEIDTGCIISTDTNQSFAPIHHRLPLVIYPQDYDRWLDCKIQEPRGVLDLMQPVRDDYFEWIPIGDAVNKVNNAGIEIQQQVEHIKPPLKKPNDQLSLF